MVTQVESHTWTGSEICRSIIVDEDIPFEEDLLRNSFNVRSWLRYLQHKKAASPNVRNIIYERGLKQVPGSYKLWRLYLEERRLQVKGRSISEPIISDVNDSYERALLFLHKMPRIWIEYLGFLMLQTVKITYTRHAFDRALKALPVTQHFRIWPLYLDFIKSIGLPETAIRVFRRFLQVSPNHVEEYIDYLMSIHEFDEAAQRYCMIIDDPQFKSSRGKNSFQLWMDLCDLLTAHPTAVKSVPVEAILRGGIRRFTDQVGRLWCALADYHVRLGHFETARDIYEEALRSVLTVRDFSQVFDAYAQFEESLISADIEDKDKQPDLVASMQKLNLDLRFARYEHLMDRRPFLLNDVLLRQNPHNVYEWLKRTKLHGKDDLKVIATYAFAVSHVDSEKATGPVSKLWLSFARYFENKKQLNKARQVFERAVTGHFKKTDEVILLWRAYVEMELRHDATQNALQLMARATKTHRSLVLWQLYADLEENLGTVESTAAIYHRMLDLKIATPEIVLTFASFLEEHHRFEDSFKAYERGLALFPYPVAFELWNRYLPKFVARYGTTKVERTRDLFEQALKDCPSDLCLSIYLLYAQYECEQGLVKNALKIYDRAAHSVVMAKRREIYDLYLRKVADFLGVAATRPIYEQAIEQLPEKDVIEYVKKYAELERTLGEVDRARAIYAHGAQWCDPRFHAEYYTLWHDFEVKYGNEDTFREMLRIKRSVQAKYHMDVSSLTAMHLTTDNTQGEQKESASVQESDPMARLEKEAQEKSL